MDNFLISIVKNKNKNTRAGFRSDHAVMIVQLWSKVRTSSDEYFSSFVDVITQWRPSHMDGPIYGLGLQA